MRKPKLRELGEALRVLFLEGPYTAKFPKEMTVPPDAFRGKPEFDEEICIGCGACSEVCPSRSIEVIDDLDKGKRVINLHYDICNFCGQCHDYCTTKDGIDYSSDYDLAGPDRAAFVVSIEKELAICEICGGSAGTKDHLSWIAKRLGSLAFANPTLTITGLESQGQSDSSADRSESRRIGREDIFRVLCPDCRRKVYLTEEWGEQG